MSCAVRDRLGWPPTSRTWYGPEGAVRAGGGVRKKRRLGCEVAHLCLGGVVRRLWLGLLSFGAACGSGPAMNAVPQPSAGVAETVEGVVRSSGTKGTPVPNATVRVQATATHGVTGRDGRFGLALQAPAADSYLLTACAPGYYCTGPVAARAGQRDVSLSLDPLPAHDDAGYRWRPSRRSNADANPDEACQTCHSAVGTDLAFPLPFDDWREDAHAASARNARFLTMYTGSHVDGRTSAATRFEDDPDYGRTPLPRDPQLPWFGPGFRLDHPDAAGSCAACHVPLAAASAPTGTDPTSLSGVDAEGVACDLCHKTIDVRVDPQTRLPASNLPGVLSMELRRPPPERQLFLGPLDDVAPGDDSYAPIFEQSRFCASCHHGVFWNTLVYGSYAEWLASPWSDAQTGRTCQDCHMPRGGRTRFAHPEGLVRDPATLASHRMPGASDHDLLRAAVSLGVRTEREAGRLRVEVTLRNVGAGHHVPTGSPMRQLILVARAYDPAGEELACDVGPTLPDWVGVGDPEDGRFAGLCGKAYAKVLEDSWTGRAPTAAYWNPVRLVIDNRLAAGQTDVVTWAFALPNRDAARVDVTLLYRRAFIDLAQRKGWSDDDIVLAERSLRSGQGGTSSR